MDPQADEEAIVKSLVSNLSDDAKLVLVEVLRLEKEKLHMKNPRGIVEDIVSNVKALLK
jgi:hypothetical protein